MISAWRHVTTKLATSTTTLSSSLRLPSFARAFSVSLDGQEKNKGFVKWFDPKKGFGFLSVDAAEEGAEGTDVFCHWSAIQGSNGFKSLADGEPVEFTAEKDETGRLRAVNVTGPDGAAVQGRPRPTYNSFGGFGGGPGGYGGG
eukprot:CAMPEP_0194048832 /NCGR_PEP_ID=MMETSP0009_2-20130614/28692_1 /TAXON_ID=210454 /ORGANISM="Grammatophora oceanica, Strain CCMP 410" /LENGTH=143 /DNA_ID=CAMNT_0038694827 /DNA_START=58 /DNA_END=485 /DNA_ORIENTATION=-